MKKLWAVLILLLMLPAVDVKASPKYTLKEAINRGLVEAVITGTGEYYGDDVIRLIIRYLTDRSFEIEIPMGRILEVTSSEYWDYQNLVVASDYTIKVYSGSKGEVEEFFIPGFCIEIDDKIPQTYVEYALGGKASYRLMRLLETINDEGMRNSIISQIAVWAITDGPDAVKRKLSEEGVPESEVKYALKEAQELLDDAGVSVKLYEEDWTDRLGCLVATAAYGSELSPEVRFLRRYRDEFVNTTYLGSRFLLAFNRFYYSWSPYVAEAERENDLLRSAVRIAITPMITALRITSLEYEPRELAVFTSGTLASALIGIFYLGIPMILRRGRWRRFERKMLYAVIVELALITVSLILRVDAVASVASFLYVISVMLIFPYLTSLALQALKSRININLHF